MLYLIHFRRPYYHARHYLGYCGKGRRVLLRRLARHRRGDGAKLLRAVQRAGHAWKVVRVWPGGDRTLERRLKRWGKGKLCPLCRRARVRAAWAILDPTPRTKTVKGTCP